jgi:predicted enzyme related to lactoylglutathione lyase
MGAKLIIVTLPADDPDGLQDFYADVLEYDFAPSLSDENAWHAVASVDGVDFSVNSRHPGESPMPHFAVDDLDGAIARAEARGGTTVWSGDLNIPDQALEDYRKLHQRERGAGTVTNTAGRAAIVQDPQGGFFGLIDPAEHTHEHFKVGRFAQSMTEKQLRTHREAIRIGRRWKEKKP